MKSCACNSKKHLKSDEQSAPRNLLQLDAVFNLEWTFKHALSQCTSHKLNRNYIRTVDWWLALTLAPSDGVGENYWELDQSQSSITSEEL